MTATTILESWEVNPNSGLKKVCLLFPNTTDENDTFDITLTDYGINPTGLLTIKSWVHTTSGEVIVTDIATCSVSSGTCTIILQSANTNNVRVVELMGRGDKGVFV